MVEIALERPELSPRELAWRITDSEGTFISESSVYRILKRFDLVTRPAYIVLAAADEFRHKTRRVHESLDNLTPADVYHGRDREILPARNAVKLQTLKRRRRENLGLPPLKIETIKPPMLRQSVS